MAKVAILGAGAWGSALACIAVRAGHRVSIWGRSAQVLDEINTAHTNRNYLGKLMLEEAISATADLGAAVRDASIILLSVPTQTLAENLKALETIAPDTVLVPTCKGIDRSTGMLPCQLVSQTFPQNPVAALSGPSFATDVVSNLPTAVTIASSTQGIAEELCRALSTDTFRCYANHDVTGVELGGALKNVLALAVGAARGMQLGASAEAALIARGFSEINRLAMTLGAKADTLTGLSGLGDLVLTCSSEQSRNFTYGMAMGRGDSLKGLKLAEGAFTAGVALELAAQQKIDTPITRAIVNVLQNNLTAREAVHALLTRPLKRET
ncbi:MAG: NAD(P)H-dependent glycerol-3-phosphate dehydrogenase [Pseudomonadota bacterium]